MFRFGFLFGPDLGHLCPDPFKFRFAGFAHVQFLRQTQRSKGYHDAADFLIGFADRAVEHIINPLMTFAGGKAAGLNEFKRFFDETVISFLICRRQFFRRNTQKATADTDFERYLCSLLGSSITCVLFARLLRVRTHSPVSWLSLLWHCREYSGNQLFCPIAGRDHSAVCKISARTILSSSVDLRKSSRSRTSLAAPTWASAGLAGPTP